MKWYSGDGKNYGRLDLGMNSAERGQDLRLEWCRIDDHEKLQTAVALLLLLMHVMNSHVCICIYMHIYVHIHMYINILYACMYICTYRYILVYTLRELWLRLIFYNRHAGKNSNHKSAQHITLYEPCDEIKGASLVLV